RNRIVIRTVETNSIIVPYDLLVRDVPVPCRIVGRTRDEPVQLEYALGLIARVFSELELGERRAVPTRIVERERGVMRGCGGQRQIVGGEAAVRTCDQEREDPEPLAPCEEGEQEQRMRGQTAQWLRPFSVRRQGK